MINKDNHGTDDKPMLRVTFCIPESMWADKIHLVGDFNDWNRTSHPLVRDRNGKWVIAVLLEPCKEYQFRYLIDGERWTNDENADAYVSNSYATHNFVVITDPDFEKSDGPRSTDISGGILATNQ